MRVPVDVQAFIDRRELCDHFRGEIPDPDDVERMQAVLEEIGRTCPSTDRELDRLKKKYVNDILVMSRLDAYDTSIEALDR